MKRVHVILEMVVEDTADNLDIILDLQKAIKEKGLDFRTGTIVDVDVEVRDFERIKEIEQDLKNFNDAYRNKIREVANLKAHLALANSKLAEEEKTYPTV